MKYSCLPGAHAFKAGAIFGLTGRDAIFPCMCLWKNQRSSGPPLDLRTRRAFDRVLSDAVPLSFYLEQE